VHWADGGETTKENLMLLCGRHHRLLHEGGYTIHKNVNKNVNKSFAGDWYFRSATNKIISESPHYKPQLDDASRDGFSLDHITESMALYAVL
jgi:hypothetical protein